MKMILAITTIMSLWNTSASAKCLSFSEARKETKGYISWRYERGTRQRCWGNYSSRRARPVADFDPPAPRREEPAPIPEATPLPYFSPELVPSPPVQLPEETGIVYSTFDGEPPDVWPPPEKSSRWWIWLIIGGASALGYFAGHLLIKSRKGD